jgi:hypothetical protein
MSELQGVIVPQQTFQGAIPESAKQIPGPQGPQGADGREILLQKSATHIQWKYEDGEWTNLVALSDLKGDKGDPADLLIATESALGGIKVGENLKIDENGTLSVDTAKDVEQDNTKPVTSAAVYVQLGNVEALLSAL